MHRRTGSRVSTSTATRPSARPRGEAAGGRSAGGRRPTLGTHRSQVFPEGNGPAQEADRAQASRARRDERLRQRRWLWGHSVRERTRDCGRKSRALGGPAVRMSGEGHDARMGVAGLITCGSMTCPCCAAKIGAHRAEEITATLRAHRDDHARPEFKIAGGAVLITLTLRHHRGQSLESLLTALRSAWKCVNSGRAPGVEKEQSGICGWIAALEITWSRDHGYHPHLHVVVMTDVPVSNEHAQNLGEMWWMRWERGLAAHGISTLMDKGGLDVRVCDLDDPSTGALGDYLSKVGQEVAGSAAKEGRDGSFSTFGLLREVISTYEADAFSAWEQLERTINGQRRKFISWSKGASELRKRVTGPVATDEEIAATDLGSQDLIIIDPADWPKLRIMLECLFAVGERDGMVAACAWLDCNGIGWTPATAAPRRRKLQQKQRAPRPTRPPTRGRL